MQPQKHHNLTPFIELNIVNFFHGNIMEMNRNNEDVIENVYMCVH